VSRENKKRKEKKRKEKNSSFQLVLVLCDSARVDTNQGVTQREKKKNQFVRTGFLVLHPRLERGTP